jgi:hypothetical protein
MRSFSGSTSSPGNAPKRKSRQGRRNIMLIVLGLGFLLAVIGYGFWRSEPAYWKRNQQFLKGRDTVTLLQMADEFEKKLREATPAIDSVAPGPPSQSATGGNGKNAVAATAPVGPLTQAPQAASQPRLITITMDEANAWLASKLEGYLSGQKIRLPREIGDMMLATEAGNLVLAFKYASPRLTQVISAPLRINVLPDGQASIVLGTLRAGSLPVPGAAQLMAGLAERIGGPQAIMVMGVLMNGEPFDPVRSIDRRRGERLMDVKVRDGAIDITLRTEPTGS